MNSKKLSMILGALLTAFAFSAFAQEESGEAKGEAEAAERKPATSMDEIVAQEDDDNGAEAKKEEAKKEEVKKEEAAPVKEEALEKAKEDKTTSEAISVEQDDEEWKEWEGAEWKEDVKPKTSLQFLELHGYFRMRGDWFYNFDLGTYNPFIQSPAETPNNSRGSTKVLPPVESRPYDPSLLKQGDEEIIKDKGESLKALKDECYSQNCYTAPSSKTQALRAKIAQLEDLINRGVIKEQDANAEDKKIVRRRSSYLGANKGDKSLRSVNMRLRLNPILNISEDIRIMSQIDILDNVVLGSTPDTLGSANINSVSPLPPFSTAQVPPSDGRNSLTDSIRVKRVWGEVMTPIGQLRFGRMGSNWGLGLLANDGNTLDSDYGSTVDRVMFITKVFGIYIIPAFDFIYQGVTNADSTEYGLAGGQFYDVSQKDDVNQYILALAYREDEAVVKQKLENGQPVFQGGVYGVYRKQDWDMPDIWKLQGQFYDGINQTLNVDNMVYRDLDLWIPDVWFKFMIDKFRFETEWVMVIGKMGNDTKDNFRYDPKGEINKATSKGDTLYVEQNSGTEVRHNKVDIFQWGGVVQTDYKFLKDSLKVGFEFGIASGDDHGGWGLRPLFKEDKQYNDRTFKNRQLRQSYEKRLEQLDKDIQNYKSSEKADDQARSAELQTEFDSLFEQYFGLFNRKDDTTINNFRFHPDYRVDMILWRELIGQVTDAMYFKPSIAYTIIDGLMADFATIYSRAMFAESTPGYDKNLGVELNLGLYYTTHDNFHIGLRGAVLFPLKGMDNLGANYTPDIVYASDNIEGFKKDIANNSTENRYDPASARNPEDIEANQVYNATTAFRLQLMFAITF